MLSFLLLNCKLNFGVEIRKRWGRVIWLLTQNEFEKEKQNLSEWPISSYLTSSYIYLARYVTTSSSYRQLKFQPFSLSTSKNFAYINKAHNINRSWNFPLLVIFWYRYPAEFLHSKHDICWSCFSASHRFSMDIIL